MKKETVEFCPNYYWYDEKDIIKSEEYVLRLNIENYYEVSSNKKIYVFYKNKIYQLEKEEELLKLFELFKSRERIIIPEDKLNEFNQFVLPKIKNLKLENIPQEVATEAMVVNKLAVKILLDSDDKENILLQPKFCYNNYEFNILESGYKTYVKENNIIRDIPAETEVIKRIFTDGFELVSGRKEFVMRKEDDMYNFLQNKIEGYMNDFEVLATDKFKNKQIRQPKISNIGIRIDNGLLELDISKVNFDLDEIKNILKDYQIKKKYQKLK
ncbi:MAG: SNF2 helicase associated domain-containing protein, partial [Clostridia bacterium]|nr:SNF2 helicase associated domain-containing protein [Clostridia bacterium]